MNQLVLAHQQIQVEQLQKLKQKVKTYLKIVGNEAVIQKRIMPKVEGAIVIAEGAGNTNVKANIVSAVEAATGLLSHKVQVFEMKKE